MECVPRNPDRLRVQSTKWDVRAAPATGVVNSVGLLASWDHQAVGVEQHGGAVDCCTLYGFHDFCLAACTCLARTHWKVIRRQADVGTVGDWSFPWQSYDSQCGVRQAWPCGFARQPSPPHHQNVLKLTCGWVFMHQVQGCIAECHALVLQLGAKHPVNLMRAVARAGAAASITKLVNIMTETNVDITAGYSKHLRSWPAHTMTAGTSLRQLS